MSKAHSVKFFLCTIFSSASLLKSFAPHWVSVKFRNKILLTKKLKPLEVIFLKRVLFVLIKDPDLQRDAMIPSWDPRFLTKPWNAFGGVARSASTKPIRSRDVQRAIMGP